MGGLVAGVDVGGTFTDLCICDPATGAVRLAKVPTSMPNQADGVLAAFAAAPSTAASNLDLDAGQYDVLTPREIQVLTLIEQRYSDREIAQTLVISPFTVRAHVNSIYSKLDIHDRRGVAAKARALGLLK